LTVKTSHIRLQPIIASNNMLIYELVRDSKVNEIAEILYITNFDYSDKKVMLLAEKFRGNLKRIKRRTNRYLLLNIS